jgi:hypothetical protein
VTVRTRSVLPRTATTPAVGSTRAIQNVTFVIGHKTVDVWKFIAYFYEESLTYEKRDNSASDYPIEYIAREIAD